MFSQSNNNKNNENKTSFRSIIKNREIKLEELKDLLIAFKNHVFFLESLNHVIALFTSPGSFCLVDHNQLVREMNYEITKIDDLIRRVKSSLQLSDAHSIKLNVIQENQPKSLQIQCFEYLFKNAECFGNQLELLSPELLIEFRAYKLFRNLNETLQERFGMPGSVSLDRLLEFAGLRHSQFTDQASLIKALEKQGIAVSVYDVCTVQLIHDLYSSIERQLDHNNQPITSNKLR